MKLLRGIFRLIVGVVIAVYASLLLVSSLPVVQRWLVRQAQDVVSEELGTRVSISHVGITLFGYAQIDSLLIEDRLGYPMLFVSRASARVSLYELLDNTVRLEHAQLYGLRAALRQERPDSAWNFQFVIDALSGEKKKEKTTPWNIQLNSVIVRRGTATVNRVFHHVKESGFDPNHLSIRQLSFNGSVNVADGGDKIDIMVNRFSLAEQCGLRITDLSLNFVKRDKEMALSNFLMRMPHSEVSLTGHVKDTHWNMRANRLFVTPDDIAPIVTPFNVKGYGPVDASLVAYGDTTGCHIDTLTLNHDALRLFTDADITFRPLQASSSRTVVEANVASLAQTLKPGYEMPTFCANNYPLRFDGKLDYSEALAAVAGNIISPQGQLELDAKMYDNDKVEVKMATPEFDLSPLVAKAGNVVLDLVATGSVKRKTGNLVAHVPSITFNNRAWRNISLQAQAADSIQLNVTVADPNATGTITAIGYLPERRVMMDAAIDRVCPNAFTTQGAFDTISYSGRAKANVVIAQDVMRSHGQVEVKDVLRNDKLLTSNILLTVADDSLQSLYLSSDFMTAQFTTSNLKHLINRLEDKHMKARIRLWNEAPIDSVLGIKLSLLDTMRVDADGSTGALLARLGFDSKVKDDELHVGATAGYKQDSVWVDLTLQSPTNHTGNGRVMAHTALRDTAGIGNITATVHNLNVGYIMNLVNFHAVDFDGWASGDVEVSRLNSKPFFDGLFDIRQFTFNNADMGGLDLNISYDTESGTIGLDGLITDIGSAHSTHAYGYVRPGRRPDSGMDLYIDTRRINAAFLNRFTEGIFENVQGHASGTARVYGKFSQIDLYGDLKIDDLCLQLPVLGTTFYAAGDSVRLRPGLFDFPMVRVYDGQGGVANVTGALRHNHFSGMNYNFYVAASHILGYKFTDFGDLPFYATALASGTVNIQGSPGHLDVVVQGRPEKGSILVYNTSSPSSVTSDNFITYSAIRPDTADVDISNVQKRQEETSSTDMRIKFDLDVTTDAQLRIITDAVSNDAINLKGSGRIQAEYHNKGAFKMFGQYIVNEGDYNLSLQGAFHKKFYFRQGGTITFGGSPLQGDLNLQAVFPVYNVSLSDLSSRATFARNSVRVDCIMNLGGKCEAPRITFDFDLPNVNDDEKQMVRSLISTDEERNMQVLYLLGIGRFYSYDYAGNGPGQGNVAMKSLLSSTLSSTLNNVISNAMGNNNWTFGTSIATGDIGWSDMDVEGLVSGRLFNNRLLVNGQFGYRDRTTTGSNFIGDFDMQWLLTKSGNMAVKAYSETNDRYFTKSSLTTQGVGLVLKKDFNRFGELFKFKKPNKNKQQ